MRDILDLLQNLNESTGLAGRKPGDLFRNSQGDEITFDDIKFFPEEGGKFTPEELDQAIADVEQQVGEIEWQNQKTARAGGFGIATFTGASGTMVVGRYLESVKPNVKDNYISNTFGDFKYAGKAAAKIQSGLSPQDLLGMRVDLDTSDIMNQLAMSLGTDNPLYAVAHRIATGTPLPVTFPTP